MIREKQITTKASRYVKDTHSPSHVSEFQAAMNIAVIKAFTAGAQWADETMLKEVLYWLEDTAIDDADGCNNPIVSFIGFESKEQMLQSFKERFNIE